MKNVTEIKNAKTRDKKHNNQKKKKREENFF